VLLGGCLSSTIPAGQRPAHPGDFGVVSPTCASAQVSDAGQRPAHPGDFGVVSHICASAQVSDAGQRPAHLGDFGVVSPTCASAQVSDAGQRPAHAGDCVGQKLSVAGIGSLSVFRCWCLGDSQQRMLKPFSDPRFCFTPKLLHYGIRARDVVIRWLDHANSALDQSVT